MQALLQDRQFVWQQVREIAALGLLFVALGGWFLVLG
jgi:hypothetical protein